MKIVVKLYDGTEIVTNNGTAECRKPWYKLLRRFSTTDRVAAATQMSRDLSKGFMYISNSKSNTVMIPSHAIKYIQLEDD